MVLIGNLEEEVDLHQMEINNKFFVFFSFFFFF